MVTISPFRNGLMIREEDGKVFVVKAPIYSLKHIRQLARRAIVIGYIGPNGGGKSVNAAKEAALSHLIPGKTVFSNMKLECRVVEHGSIKEYRSLDIDQLDIKTLSEKYRDCLILLDETNIDILEARRAMADANLKTIYLIQQKRKRNVDVIWTAMSEMDVDSRLRQKTDIFVRCYDLSMDPGYAHVGNGEISRLEYIDYSGMIVPDVDKYPQKATFKKCLAYNRPWWNIYDTNEMQMPHSLQEAEPETVDPLVLSYAERMKSIMDASGEDKMLVRELQHVAGIPPDKRLRRQISAMLARWGIEVDASYRYYEKFGVVDLSEANA